MDPERVAKPNTDDDEVARERVVRLFRFVEAVYAQRNPVVRQVNEHSWVLRVADIPEDASIALISQAELGGSGDDERPILLRCTRPMQTPPPPCPAELEGWLGRDWQDCRNDPKPIESRNEQGDDGDTRVIAFDGDPERLAALEAYRTVWEIWSANERRVLQAGELFERLYALRAVLERDGERFELGIADGVLVWRRDEGGVRHPLLFRPVRLEFTPEIPEFRIVEAGSPSEFYSALFRSMPDVDGTAVGRLRAEAESLDLHPLAGAEVDGFLRNVALTLSARGQFVGYTGGGAEREEPVIERGPVFLLRRRTSGFANAISATVEAAQAGIELPRALINVVGKGLQDRTVDIELSGSDGRVAVADAGEDADVLFTKPSNAEQLDIARSLERNDCVLVQGPPGTGKTHTIANLLGHLLAQGKSVLVVSHTTKALKVLRDKVVAELQPLCVSVLDSAADDAALKSSIEGIVARLGSSEKHLLARDIDRYTAERDDALQEVKELRAAVLAARQDEVRSIVVGGEGVRPIEAAKFVADRREKDDWMPGPVVLGEALPLTVAEVLALYRTNESVTREDEEALRLDLPDLSDLPDPDQFDRLVRERVELQVVDRDHRTDLWSDVPATDELNAVLEAVVAGANVIQEWPDWTGRLVLDGVVSRTARKTWEKLVEEIESLRETSMSFSEAIVAHQPQIIAVSQDPRRTEDVYRELAVHVSSTGKVPNLLQLVTRRDWKLAIEGATVSGGIKPRLPEHFEALARAATLARIRGDLLRRWETQVVSIGGPTIPTEESEPERLLERYRPLLSAALGWFEQQWVPICARLVEAGFRWDTCKTEADTRFAEEDEVARLRRIVREVLPPCFAAEHARRRWFKLEAEFAAAETAARAWASGGAAEVLRSALQQKMPDAYRSAYAEIRRLEILGREARMREQLLARLERVAVGWVGALRSRTGVHGGSTVPGDVVAAWRWRQYNDELERRNMVSLPEILRRLEQARERLREVTATLVDRKAWHAQVLRTTREQRMALMTFAQAKKSIGRGTGKRAGTLAKVARESLTEARSAVPVWIMPIVKAAEMFDPRRTKFDVVIVDEASQSDVTGLLPFFLGRQVVVVGDDEQVSPSAVGEEITEAQHLIDEFLQGIPAAQLYTGKQSLYDIAKRTFGGTTCLLEHFRCVPDIIRFSNHLSYDGAIRPLREGLPDLPQPAVVAHRVSSRGADGKINEDEACTVAALVKACTEQREYAGKTFGVISLVGEEQARRIEQILHAMLTPEEVEARRFLAGNASQFQGDERHVMFLSMVQSGAGVPLSILQERTAQQRFNVAASRAQDQMWVVYSLDLATELKSGDLRRRLIEHAIEPNALARNEEVALKRAESPFEVEVIRRLSAAGYRVKAQHWVGAYRIDIVVESHDGPRLAVECDGERFHRPDDLQRDIERQTILERVGWTFERIRGSLFYRDPEKAMKPVFERLRAMNIAPSSGDHSAELNRDNELVTRVRARAAEIMGERDDLILSSLCERRRRSERSLAS